MQAAKSFIFLILLIVPFAAYGKTGITNTKHNLSVTGPGEIRALTETRICVFCHTPHNAAPQTPLWNKAIRPTNYVLYESTTLRAPLRQPDGPSRLCLSCHDGTIALGAVLRPSGGISMSREITPDRLSYIGTVLRSDHPVSFSYYASLPNPELYSSLPAGVKFYGNGDVQCTSCHDAHDNTYGKFLVMDNRFSALCTACHVMNGWTGSTHSSSASPVNGALPIVPRDWPAWTSVGEWGCEGCHVSHNAGSSQRLLYYQNEENNCYTCHSGNVAQKNIYMQFQKASRHPVEVTTGIHDPTEPIAMTFGHVECVDCHNPHAVNNNKMVIAPFASGRLDKVNGVGITGAVVSPISYEYEVCFRCHADSALQIPFVPRVVNTTNKRLQFSTVNASYHPVAGMGRNPNVPSIPSTDPEAPTNMTAASLIYCSDCHSDDSNSRGPHGSSYAPILRRRYETSLGTMESYDTYSLCYRCHNRTSLLQNDIYFKKHQSHLMNGVPCSACHDSHGIIPDGGLTGSHTHLINFDTRVTMPVTGQTYPLYTDKGNGSGTCVLVCHGVIHNPLSY